MEGLFRDGTAEATELIVLPAGTTTSGEFHCSECGYGVSVSSRLPRCPMCSGDSWQQVAWRAAGAMSPVGPTA